MTYVPRMAEKIAVRMTYDAIRKRIYIVPIIVMALSLFAVVILWATFGHIGPTFSSDAMTLQRGKLRQLRIVTGTRHHQSENTANPALGEKLTT